MIFLPGHPLVAIGTKMVESNSDPHLLVLNKLIVMAKQHDLVVVPEPVVRDRDVGRAPGHIEEPVVAFVESVVVDPHP